ncbi:uncharacterized protein ALTATR162_LOCUS6568 [Alternaria atra]|uniref:Uncharacterized protein n=1 Tax=Alternaria atra TaxID=119953 RepID=A0A8J2N0W3_9PLEO|nr:uncharacterized protein ALTATR162_LOCUS6568 [Alternaria atra]CAG5163873.1 unnamed protein product [Alternaria atra]
MQHFLHAPRNSIVFATINSSISRFLRHQHKWAGVKTERNMLPEYINVSCLRELENGEVEIDIEHLNGNQLAGEIRALLMRDGFVEPDFRFVGRFVRLGRAKQGHNNDGAGKRRVGSWDEDGLGEARV